MKYIYYKTDGTYEILEREARMPLEEMQKLVGGLIEFAPQRADGSFLVVNEEGLINRLPDNPFALYENQGVEGHYKGDMLHGMNDENGEFVGFEDPTPYLLKKIELSPKLFDEGNVITIISIGDFMAQTTRGEVKTTGRTTTDGSPIFKEAKKGARKMFTLRNLKKADTLLFAKPYSQLPFIIDGDMKNPPDARGFTSRTIRGNALINLHGNIDVIKEWVTQENINPYFQAFDRINHISADGTETLLFTEVPASCRLVQDLRVKQMERVHQAITA